MDVVGLIDWSGAGERRSVSLPNLDDPAEVEVEEAVIDSRGDGTLESIRLMSWTLR